ncbi:MAG: CARDB domain-containing protein [Candidatus Margulisiibacteriota bacterium]
MLKKILILFVIGLVLLGAWYVFCPASVSGAGKTIPTSTLVKATSGPLPDLVVSKLQVKPYPKKAKNVVVMFEIKNQGGDLADNPNVKIEIMNDAGQVVDSRTIENFTPGAKAGSCVFTIDDTKKYQVKATADYNNYVRESDENNNNRQLTFSIGRTI